jgi:hypothetical protein
LKHFPKYFALLLLFAGCGSGDPKPVDIGSDYFPLQTGRYQVYAVSEKHYSEGKEPTLSDYQLKVEVTDSFPNPGGGYTYVLNRSKRMDASEEWAVLDTWSARKTDAELVVNEENISYLKLVFPVKKGQTWNGNQYNSQNKDDYTLDNVDVPYTTPGGTTFEKSLTVNQENNDDLIVFHDIRKEIYARNVGLVFRSIVQLNYCSTENCVGQQVVNEGIEYQQTIIDYGAK